MAREAYWHKDLIAEMVCLAEEGVERSIHGDEQARAFYMMRRFGKLYPYLDHLAVTVLKHYNKRAEWPTAGEVRNDWLDWFQSKESFQSPWLSPVSRRFIPALDLVAPHSTISAGRILMPTAEEELLEVPRDAEGVPTYSSPDQLLTGTFRNFTRSNGS